MATPKVRPNPPTNELSASGSPFSDKSGMNGVKGVLPEYLQLNPNHWVFRASSFPLSQPFLSARLCAIPTPNCSCVACKGDVRMANHGLVFGSLCVQHPLPASPWPYSVQNNNLGSKNFPANLQAGQCTSEPIVVPTFSHFKVQDCCDTGFQGYHLADSQQVDSDSPVDSETITPNGINPRVILVTGGNDCKESSNSNGNPNEHGKTSLVLSPLPTQESHVEASGCSTKFSDIIPGSHDDEIATRCNDIHVCVNAIHANCDSDQGSEYYSDYDGGDNEDDIIPCSLSEPGKPQSTPPESSHAEPRLTVSECHLQLKKLLSDESGYCDSALLDMPTSPCNWSGKNAVLLNEEDYEEWDDDISTDGEVESSDTLWKSFEDCIWSPHTPAKKPKPPADILKTLFTAAETSTEIGAPDANNVAEFEGMMQSGTDCASAELYQDSHIKHSSHVKIHSGICKGESRHDLTTTDTSKAHVITEHTQCSCSSLKQVYTCSLVEELAIKQVPVLTGSQMCSARKQVRFPSDSSISVVHEMVAWNYAYRAARKGPWEEYARNRAHFRRKIDSLTLVIEPCLAKKIAKYTSTAIVT